MSKDARCAEQGYEPNPTLAARGQMRAAIGACIIFTIYWVGLASMTTPVLAGLTIEEFERVWSMGVSSDRQRGRPKEWDGKEITFDDFSLDRRAHV